MLTRIAKSLRPAKELLLADMGMNVHGRTPYARMRIEWVESTEPNIRYEAQVEGKTLSIRVNDFPAEPYLYTLLVSGVEADSFMDFPTCWTRPQPWSRPSP